MPRVNKVRNGLQKDYGSLKERDVQAVMQVLIEQVAWQAEAVKELAFAMERLRVDVRSMTEGKRCRS